MSSRTLYRAGSPHIPGTNLPSNVTGECHHWHRTPAAAARCVTAFDRAVKRGHGQSAYADRCVMELAPDGSYRPWAEEMERTGVYWDGTNWTEEAIPG